MSSANASDFTSWQLALRGIEGGQEALANLLEARDAEVDVQDLEGRGEHLVAEFQGPPDLLIMDALGAWLDNLGLDEAELLTRRDDGPWLEGWRALFHATQVSERLWVRPAYEPAVPGRSDIIIDPTNAFGGGFHPTTAACLRMMDKALSQLPDGASVLDVGQGTGILSIGAAHLGANVRGVDTEAGACAAANKNAELNEVAERVTVVHGTLERGARMYDLVLANLMPCIALAPAILDATGKEVILSGIQTSKEEAARQAYASLTLRERDEHRGWVTLWYGR